MNQTIQDLMTRRSVRAYTDRMPSKQDIETICQAGLYAATGMGTQSPIILAVTNKAMRDRMSKLNARVMNVENDPFYGAPWCWWCWWTKPPPSLRSRTAV